MRFYKYVLNQCKKAGRKLRAVTRICKFVSLERPSTLIKSFIEWQFGYCPLVWIFCGRKSNNRINHLHERAPKIVYHDNQFSFENFLPKDRSVSICHRNIRLFATEMYKIKNNMSTPIMSELFEKRNLNCPQTIFLLHLVNTFEFQIEGEGRINGEASKFRPK